MAKLGSIILLVAIFGFVTGCTNDRVFDGTTLQDDEAPAVANIGGALIEAPLMVGEQTARMFVDMGAGMATGVGTMAASAVGLQSSSEFKVHGNWCGPNQPAPGTNPPAKDRLDRLCREHDKCYRRKGKLNCGCDVQFVRQLSETRFSEDLRPTSRLIAKYFMASGCDGCKQTSFEGSQSMRCSTSGDTACSEQRLDGDFDWCPKE